MDEGVVNQPSVRRIMAGVIPVTILTQVLSFGSSLALAHVFGATIATDAYFLGLSIPMITFGILQAALRLGAIPALTERHARQPGSFSRQSSELFTSVAVGATLLSVITTAVAVVVLPSALSDPHLADLTRTTIIELAPLGLLGALGGVLGAILAVRMSFLPAAAVLGLEPIAKTLFVLLLGDSWGASTLVWGNLVGSALAVVVLWWVARRRGVFVRFVAQPQSPLVKEVLRLSVPLLVSQSVLQVNPLIDRSMASSVSSGAVTELELGLKLFLVPATLIAGTLVAPLTATWSARKEEEPALLRQSVTRAITGVIFILPPLVVGVLLVQDQVVTLLYSGGAYTGAALHRTGGVLGMLLLGLPAQTLIILLSTLFIVHRDAIFPMKIAFANVLLNVGLNFALRPALGISGIALSTSITFTILVGAYAIVAQRRWRVFDLAELRGPFVRALVSAAGIAALG